MSGFSDMLIYLRKREGLSQQELADRLGVTRSRIGMYETAKREPDFESLEAIADFFNVNMDTLMGKPSTPESEQPIKNPDIRMIARAGEKMTAEQAENLRKYAQFMFPEAFEE